jgi:hypothetical protein
MMMATIDLSESAGNAVLDTLARMMDAGRIELMSDAQRVIAVLQLSSPAAMPAQSGELEFNSIADEDAALAQGIVTTARIIGNNGGEVFSCMVGDENSDAVIKLITPKIFRGQPVQLKSFKLVMP